MSELDIKGTVFNLKAVCEQLKISQYTLANWYRYEHIKVARGEQPYLPEPIRDENERGKPRYWTEEMVNELKDYKSKIIVGRNGVYGEFSNPYHFETKKYKKQMEEENENE